MSPFSFVFSEPVQTNVAIYRPGNPFFLSSRRLHRKTVYHCSYLKTRVLWILLFSLDIFVESHIKQ
jgi:hypothetical protein